MHCIMRSHKRVFLEGLRNYCVFRDDVSFTHSGGPSLLEGEPHLHRISKTDGECQVTCSLYFMIK